MTGPSVISFLAISLTLLAVCVVCILLLYNTRKVINKNNELTLRIQEKRSDASPLEKIREDLAASDNPARMTDVELLAWLDAKMDQMLLYTDPELDARKISEIFGVSQRRILRTMKLENAPGSVTAWLSEKRIARACKLLSARHEFTIEAISQEAGFRSRRTFQNMFKQHLGVTPSEYRVQTKNIKNNE